MLAVLSYLYIHCAVIVCEIISLYGSFTVLNKAHLVFICLLATYMPVTLQFRHWFRGTRVPRSLRCLRCAYPCGVQRCRDQRRDPPGMHLVLTRHSPFIPNLLFSEVYHALCLLLYK